MDESHYKHVTPKRTVKGVFLEEHAYKAMRDEIDRMRALLIAAECCESIDRPETWDEDDKRWRIITSTGRFYGDTLDAALADFWRSEIQFRDGEGNPIQADPFAVSAEVDTYGYSRLCVAHNDMRDELDRLRSEIRALQVTEQTLRAERDAAVADAERMRFMEDCVLTLDTVADPDNLVQVWSGTRLSTPYRGRTVREAIDAAIRARGEGQE